MQKYGLNELREKFLEFFESKGHLRLPSFSLVPKNDASLLLINSGMAPMKPWFKGDEKPPRVRICTCQKCIRTGDIDNIGHTARHGTYFEMLGNFSFGDYFKKDAIAWSWEFLTSKDWLGLDPKRLYPSVYLDDDEAADIWHNDIGFPYELIFRFGKEDNFWEHGLGPCGPCSEIYYDRGEEYGCGKEGCTVGCDCDRFIEIWNNVFTQFDNKGDGVYVELSQKNIDTGMGLERLAVVCQEVGSLFEVDTVMNIANKVSALTGVSYGQSEKTDVSLRVITDHIRSATMMLSDGILPSNEGRGYVLRRLLRRAARHGKLLGLSEPFLFEVCDTVIEENKIAYPELLEKGDFIKRVIKIEEESFAKTIDAGEKLLAEMLSKIAENQGNTVKGEDAFRLYDTYGFPVDLTAEIAGEAGFSIDRETFTKLMNEQRARARKAREALGDVAWSGVELGLDSTQTVFTGYGCSGGVGVILALAEGNQTVTVLGEGEEGLVVLDKTPFYAEMGGQVTDQGVISTPLGEFAVRDVQKNVGGKYLHRGVVTSGEIRVGDEAHSEVDSERRRAIMRAHSATHLLHMALRSVLGEHVGQSGSLVEPDSLRFDFTHYSAITPDELERIERLVNETILEGLPITAQEMSLNEAKKSGAMALFSEKYGETVRVVKMGDFSTELCGGTHLDNTAKAGSFKIKSEFSVAAGVRRIEAITGKAVMEQLRRESGLIARLSEALKTNPEGVEEKFEAFRQELRATRKALEKLQSQQLALRADGLITGAKDVSGLKFVSALLPGLTGDELRELGDILRDRESGAVVLLTSNLNNKTSLSASCGEAAVKAGIKAGELIKFVTDITGGRGGGKPERAMGGVEDVSLLEKAFADTAEFIAGKVK
ncbi:MAG: alanine--tRNA ligase [Oscillospiraceae bacterium]|jgi:alanyl-tRNA synthetase|nr:alanine--tRNA ligase [Oscillospiraceae bacterium]